MRVSRGAWGALALCAALWADEASAQFSCPAPLRFHFVALRDADGSNGTAFGSGDVQPWIDAANTILGAPAGVQFQYRADLDWEERASTPLNNQMCYGGESAAARAEADQIVAAHPGKIVVFLRRFCNGWNPSSSYAEPPNIGTPVPTGWGNGLDYVVTNNNFAPSTTTGLFAHELGHFLGLHHTFPRPYASFATNQEAANWLSAGNNFDGDLIAGTPEDPGALIWGANGLNACSAGSITLSGRTYTPDTLNVMSYYGCTTTPRILPGQVAKIQATLSHPSRRTLCSAPCYPDFHGVPVAGIDTCLGYWKHREGYGPHALSVDWSGTAVAGSLKPNRNGWIHSANRTDYENQTYLAALFGTASHHYSYRASPTPLALGATRPLGRFAGVQTYHWLDANQFVTTWYQQFNSGRTLVDVGVTNANPLEISAVWADQGGRTSATYFLPNDQAIKNYSDSFYANDIRLDRVVPYASGAGHAYLANWNYSKALRGVWSVPVGAYQGLYNSLAGLGYRIHDLEYFEGPGIVSVWEAPHNECTPGSRLHADTDVCTRKICQTHTPFADPYCCNNAWDGICVAEVTSWCGRTCP